MYSNRNRTISDDYYVERKDSVDSESYSVLSSRHNSIAEPDFSDTNFTPIIRRNYSSFGSLESLTSNSSVNTSNSTVVMTMTRPPPIDRSPRDRPPIDRSPVLRRTRHSREREQELATRDKTPTPTKFLHQIEENKKMVQDMIRDCKSNKK